jgi:hypothetical protein
MARRKSSPGISRIDQRDKRTHGFFVRLTRRGKTHSAFFTDRKYGGRKAAFAAAQLRYAALLKKFGPRTGKKLNHSSRLHQGIPETRGRKVFRHGPFNRRPLKKTARSAEA